MRQTRGTCRTLLFALLSLTGLAAHPAAGPDAEKDQVSSSRFFDPEGGWLDVGGFLETAYGFVPLIAPITEPPVGYGPEGPILYVVFGSAWMRP